MLSCVKERAFQSPVCKVYCKKLPVGYCWLLKKNPSKFLVKHCAYLIGEVIFSYTQS